MIVSIEPFDSIFIKVNFSDKLLAIEFQETVTDILENFEVIKRKNWRKFQHWDGKTKYYNLKSRLLYKGLYSKLIQFCNANNLQVHDNLVESSYNLDVDKYIRSMKITDYNNKTDQYFEISPDKFQRNALQVAINDKMCCVQLSTGAGKTLFSYCLVHMLKKHVRGKVLIVVPQIGLVNQFKNDYTNYSNFDKNFDANEISALHSKSNDTIDNPILIATMQTVVKWSDEILADVGMLIIDEAHKSKSNTLKTIITKCKNTIYKIGMSGTLQSKVDFKYPLGIQALLGDVHHIVGQRELIEEKRASDFECRVIKITHLESDFTDYKTFVYEKNKIYKLEFDANKKQRNQEILDTISAIRTLTNKDPRRVEIMTNKLEELQNSYIPTVNKKWGYIDEYEWIIHNRYRNYFILYNAMKNTEGNHLIVFSRIEEHGAILYDMAQKMAVKYDVDVYYIHGKSELKVDEAKSIIEKSGRRVIILANIQMVTVGWSVNNLHFCHLAVSLKNESSLIQLTGRLLRRDGSNIKTAMYIYQDDLKIHKTENFTYQHGNDNIKTMMAHDHPVVYNAVDFNKIFTKKTN